jgi:hypothetical protein
MVEGKNGEKVYKWNPILTRPLGRPNSRWEDDISNDMKELKIRNWTGCIEGRKDWKLYVERVGTFRD